MRPIYYAILLIVLLLAIQAVSAAPPSPPNQLAQPVNNPPGVNVDPPQPLAAQEMKQEDPLPPLIPPLGPDLGPLLDVLVFLIILVAILIIAFYFIKNFLIPGRPLLPRGTTAPSGDELTMVMRDLLGEIKKLREEIRELKEEMRE